MRTDVYIRSPRKLMDALPVPTAYCTALTVTLFVRKDVRKSAAVLVCCVLAGSNLAPTTMLMMDDDERSHQDQSSDPHLMRDEASKSRKLHWRGVAWRGRGSSREVVGGYWSWSGNSPLSLTGGANTCIYL
jgi:hypothetical protein